MDRACHLETTGSSSRGIWRGWVSSQGHCLQWMRQNQAPEEASTRAFKELGIGLQRDSLGGEAI